MYRIYGKITPYYVKKTDDKKKYSKAYITNLVTINSLSVLLTTTRQMFFKSPENLDIVCLCGVPDTTCGRGKKLVVQELDAYSKSHLWELFANILIITLMMLKLPVEVSSPTRRNFYEQKNEEYIKLTHLSIEYTYHAGYLPRTSIYNELSFAKLEPPCNSIQLGFLPITVNDPGTTFQS
ncbi:hypothetical protein BDC45DRAFT_535427 [Circinella umbellata]|nr:hypothetical protein BDC45DRAFT_535427 [Circinella umbellata]